MWRHHLKQLLVSSIILITSFVVSACQSTEAFVPSSSTTSSSSLKTKPTSPPLLSESRCNMLVDRDVLPFRKAIGEADLVAKLSIDLVVEELNSPSYSTLFQASVIQIVKGDEQLTTIHVLQDGNSICSYNENELFTPGEQYYLIMNETSGSALEHTFYIQGEETGMYKVIEDDYIVKLAYIDSDLSPINESSLSQKLQSSYNKPIMVFEEQQFVDHATMLLDQGKIN